MEILAFNLEKAHTNLSNPFNASPPPHLRNATPKRYSPSHPASKDSGSALNSPFSAPLGTELHCCFTPPSNKGFVCTRPRAGREHRFSEVSALTVGTCRVQEWGRGSGRVLLGPLWFTTHIRTFCLTNASGFTSSVFFHSIQLPHRQE